MCPAHPSTLYRHRRKVSPAHSRGLDKSTARTTAHLAEKNFAFDAVATSCLPTPRHSCCTFPDRPPYPLMQGTFRDPLPATSFPIVALCPYSQASVLPEEHPISKIPRSIPEDRARCCCPPPRVPTALARQLRRFDALRANDPQYGSRCASPHLQRILSWSPSARGPRRRSAYSSRGPPHSRTLRRLRPVSRPATADIRSAAS